MIKNKKKIKKEIKLFYKYNNNIRLVFNKMFTSFLNKKTPKDS